MLTAAKFPELGTAWFLTLWNSTFGLSLLIGLAAVMIHSMIFVFKANYPTIASAVVGYVRLAFNGAFLLLVVVTIMGIVDFLIRLMTSWISGLVDILTWTESLTALGQLSGVNIWLTLAISNLGMVIGNMLFLQTLMMNFWIYIFVIWYLLGSALGVGKVAQFVRSLIFAGLVTVLFARVPQVFHLGLSAVVLGAAQSIGLPPITIYLGVVASGAIALLIPAFMLVAFTIAAFRVERRLDVRAFIDRQSRNVTNADQSQLAEERVGNLRKLGDGAKDAAGGALRWAAMAAATATFAKIGAGIAAKAAATAPTPQTKLVAAGLMGAQAGARWLEVKTKNYINNRVGRPGASRARTRQQGA